MRWGLNKYQINTFDRFKFWRWKKHTTPFFGVGVCVRRSRDRNTLWFCTLFIRCASVFLWIFMYLFLFCCHWPSSSSSSFLAQRTLSFRIDSHMNELCVVEVVYALEDQTQLNRSGPDLRISLIKSATATTHCAHLRISLCHSVCACVCACVPNWLFCRCFFFYRC